MNDLVNGFVNWMNFRTLPMPNRVYLHKAGLELYDDKHHSPIMQAFNLAEEKLADYYSTVTGDLPEWMIAAAWTTRTAGKSRLILDVFEFKDAVRNWPGNPDVSAFNIGLIAPTRASSCGDTMMLLGEEERLRRDMCKTLEEYAKLQTPLILIPQFKYYARNPSLVDKHMRP